MRGRAGLQSSLAMALTSLRPHTASHTFKRVRETGRKERKNTNLLRSNSLGPLSLATCFWISDTELQSEERETGRGKKKKKHLINLGQIGQINLLLCNS